MNKEHDNTRSSEYHRTHKHTIDGFTRRVWNSLRSRTINGRPNWSNPADRWYLERGIRLEITRDELKVFIAANGASIQAIWDAGDVLPSIDRIDPNGHYNLDNIRIISLSEHICVNVAYETHAKVRARKTLKGEHDGTSVDKTKSMLSCFTTV